MKADWWEWAALDRDFDRAFADSVAPRDRRAEPTEVVLTRIEAWHLFGLDAGDLREERIPGLVLLDDTTQAHRYLQMPGPRRLLITSDTDIDPFQPLVQKRQGQLAIISLVPGVYECAEVDAHGLVTTSSLTTAIKVQDTLPTLTRQAAHTQLMALPTVRQASPPTGP